MRNNTYNYGDEEEIKKRNTFNDGEWQKISRTWSSYKKWKTMKEWRHGDRFKVEEKQVTKPITGWCGMWKGQGRDGSHTIVR